MSTAYHTAQSQPVGDPRQGQDVPVVIHPSPAGGPVEGNQVRGTETTYVNDKKFADRGYWLRDHRAGAAFVVFLASIVLFVQTGNDCTPRSNCDRYRAWGLAVAVLSTFFSLILFFLLTLRGDSFREDIVEDVPTHHKQHHHGHRLLATLLFLIWIAGAGVLTFRQPYNVPGNAYYACWLAFVASAYLFFQAFHFHLPYFQLNCDAPRLVLWLLLLASVVELTQASINCRFIDCKRLHAWALAVGVISTAIALICLLIAITRRFLPNILLKLVSLLLFAMWICGAGVLTFFGGPFNALGNAYYACWAAFLTSGYLFYLAWFNRWDAVQTNQNQLAPK